jgi:hypothetical protein
MTGSEFVSSVALVPSSSSCSTANQLVVEESMKIVSFASALLAIAEPSRRFSSASCSSRLRNES